MKKIDFTVLMCTCYYDNPRLLKLSVESIFKNTINPDFFILTIDGDIPKTNWNIINQLSDKYKIQINIIKKNVGLALALNNAINLVKTKWIARADSDDINMTNRFEKQIESALNDYDVIGSNILEFDQSNRFKEFEKKMPLNNIDIKEYLKSRNPINHMTAFYKTDLVKKVGGYPNIYKREDYGLWIKLINYGAIFCNIDETLVKVNAGGSLYKRRRGIRNIPAEFTLQLLSYRLKIKPIHIAVFHYFIRVIILLLPSKILGKFYTNQLREKRY